MWVHSCGLAASHCPPNWLLDVGSACKCGRQPKNITVLLLFYLFAIAFEQGLQQTDILTEALFGCPKFIN